uniref:rRNA-processing protein EBP2 n=1 Tax=Schistocephalus solidus TaxID=70667 RepID=A0A0X3Q6Y9_SCHSO
MSDSESDADLQELASVPGLYREVEIPKTYINNKPMLVSALERLRNRLPWLERLDIVNEPAPPPKDTDLDNDISKIDPNDDFKREAFFYRQAQAAVLEAIPRLHELNVPTRRPADYFAEMIKSDDHMVKVREHIVINKKRLELREKARQLRQARKFGKDTQKEVLEARRLEKKKHMDALKAVKRRPGGKEQAQLLEDFLSSGKQTGKKKSVSNEKEQNRTFYRPKDVANRRKINYKRAFKNQKYGHGGQKKRSKRNDAESIRSMGQEVRVLTHKASATRVNKLKKSMLKTKKKNAQKQKKKLSKL